MLRSVAFLTRCGEPVNWSRFDDLMRWSVFMLGVSLALYPLLEVPLALYPLLEVPRALYPVLEVPQASYPLVEEPVTS